MGISSSLVFEITSVTHHTLEIKQSKFIAILVPIKLLESTIEQLKQEHPKARHIIVSWRKINEYQQIVEYATDDKEPKGTAGKPILNVLRGDELVNCAVIVVRYFGGTKLGTGGLVRAYSQVVKELIAKSTKSHYVFKFPFVLSLPYSQSKSMTYFIEQEGFYVSHSRYEANMIEIDLLLSEKEKNSLEQRIKEQHDVTLNKAKN